MATRANIKIKTGYGDVNLQANSSAYPSWIMDFIITFIASAARKFEGKILWDNNPDSFALSKFIEDAGLTIGKVGNPSYFYEIDFENGRYKVWKRNKRWIKAPDNWKELGWEGLYQNEDGVLGYPKDVKGRLLLDKPFGVTITDVVSGMPKINKLSLEYAKNIAND